MTCDFFHGCEKCTSFTLVRHEVRQQGVELNLSYDKIERGIHELERGVSKSPFPLAPLHNRYASSLFAKKPASPTGKSSECLN